MMSGICEGKTADIHNVNLIKFLQKTSEEKMYIS